MVILCINGNSIRNTFTDYIPIHAMFMYIVLVYILAQFYFHIKLNFRLSYPNLGINYSVNTLKITPQEFKNNAHKI